MKRLYLLRHAESPAQFGAEDLQRALSDKGKEDARKLGDYCQRAGYVPDYILCSDAVRTKQTLDGFLESIARPKIDFSNDVYRGSRGDYLSLLQGMNDAFQASFLVGHNPSIHAIAASLATDDHADYDRLMMGYAPCTLTVLDCPIERWADLAPARNALIKLIAPSDLP